MQVNINDQRYQKKKFRKCFSEIFSTKNSKVITSKLIKNDILRLTGNYTIEITGRTTLDQIIKELDSFGVILTPEVEVVRENLVNATGKQPEEFYFEENSENP